jgi:hypothetical protein
VKPGSPNGDPLVTRFLIAVDILERAVDEVRRAIDAIRKEHPSMPTKDDEDE